MTTRIIPPPRTPHGMAESPEYRAWHCLRSRCDNSKDKGYKNYGGRGITYDPAWVSFICFIEDMGVRPSKDFQIDRIDNNGNYAKDNCRWVTAKTNSRNRRSSHFITFKGETKCMTEWCEQIGISRSCMRTRILLDWPMDKIMSTPVKSAR